MQRSKPLTHPEQIILRKRYQQKKENKKRDQEEKNAEKEKKETFDIFNGNK